MACRWHPWRGGLHRPWPGTQVNCCRMENWPGNHRPTMAVAPNNKGCWAVCRPLPRPLPRPWSDIPATIENCGMAVGMLLEKGTSISFCPESFWNIFFKKSTLSSDLFNKQGLCWRLIFDLCLETWRLIFNLCRCYRLTWARARWNPFVLHFRVHLYISLHIFTVCSLGCNLNPLRPPYILVKIGGPRVQKKNVWASHDIRWSRSSKPQACRRRSGLGLGRFPRCK